MAETEQLCRPMQAGMGSDKELRPPRRATLLGSPMRSPAASPSTGPAAWPRAEVPSMSLDGEEAAALQAAIEASLGDDMKRRLRSSLQSTEQELWSECPEGEEGGRDLKRARLRTSSELEAAVEAELSKPASGRSSFRASPALGPVASPALQAAGCEVQPCEFRLDGLPLVEEVEEEAQPRPQPAVVTEESRLMYDGLLDHELLLESLYAAQGVDLRAQQDKATAVLAELGLRALDLGVKNWDEEGRELVNQCFYLSLARSYLGPAPGALEVQKAALLLKRTVEACVLAAHPDWARDDNRLGESAMAFADFLPVAMAASDPPNLVARLAVLILDATQGHAEVYLGPLYAKDPAESEPEAQERPREELERSLVLLCYTPGHYKALVCDDAQGSKPAWTYEELKGLLDQRGVMCIETSDFT